MPAYAHYPGRVPHYFNGNLVATGRVLHPHTAGNSVEACDRRADGYGAYVKVWLKNGETPSVGDSNGAADGCDYRSFGSLITKFEVCINNNTYWSDSCTKVNV